MLSFCVLGCMFRLVGHIWNTCLLKTNKGRGAPSENRNALDLQPYYSNCPGTCMVDVRRKARRCAGHLINALLNNASSLEFVVKSWNRKFASHISSATTSAHEAFVPIHTKLMGSVFASTSSWKKIEFAWQSGCDITTTATMYS